MKKIEFDAESPLIQEKMMAVVAASKAAVILGRSYENDFATHMTNDLAYTALLEAHAAAIELIKAILLEDKVSFEDLIKDIKPE